MDRRVIAGGLAAVSLVVVAVFSWSRDDGAPDDAEVVAPRAGPSVPAERPVPVAPTDADAVVEDAVTAAETAARPLTLGVDVVVRHPDGVPAAGARVALVRDDVELGAGVTDRDGRLAFRDVFRDGPLSVRVSAVTARPHVEHFDVVDAPLVVTLPAGVDVAGVVTIDGARPTGDVELSAYSFESGIWTANDGPFTVTAVDGAFRTSGFTPGDEVRLEVPYEYALRDGSDGIDAVAPDVDVVVDLVTRPMLVARVVDAGGRPVRHAEIVARFAGPSTASGGQRLTDDDGRAQWDLSRRHGDVDVTLDTSAPDGSARARLVVEGVDASVGHDAGDLVLDPGRVVDVRVVDVAGVPIADAVARPRVDGRASRRGYAQTGRTSGWSEPSDDDGRLRVRAVLDDEAWLEVVALRHGPAVVSLPPSPIASTTVVLEACAVLDVVFDGDELDGFRLDVTMQGDIFDVGLGVHPARVGLGATDNTTGVFGSQESTLHYDVEPRVVLAGLTPDRPVELEVATKAGSLLWGPEVVTLARGEHREVRVDLRSRATWRLRGRVVGDDGRSVAYGTVRVIDGEGMREEVPFAGGSFLLEGLQGELVEIEIDGPGVLPTRFEVASSDPPHLFRVPRGRTVAVHVLDPTGAPVGDAGVSAWRGGAELARNRGSEASPAYRLAGLPEGEVTIRVDVPGRTYDVEHDTAVPRVDVVVERCGSLSVSWTGSLGEGLHFVMLEDPETGGSYVQEYVDDAALDARRYEFASVAPGRYRVRLVVLKPPEPIADVVVPQVVAVADGHNEVELPVPE